jgi:hypothetical protein
VFLRFLLPWRVLGLASSVQRIRTVPQFRVQPAGAFDSRLSGRSLLITWTNVDLGRATPLAFHVMRQLFPESRNSWDKPTSVLSGNTGAKFQASVAYDVREAEHAVLPTLILSRADRRA